MKLLLKVYYNTLFVDAFGEGTSTNGYLEYKAALEKDTFNPTHKSLLPT